MCCGGAGVEFRRHRGGPSVPMHDRGSAGFLHRCLQETTGRLRVRGAVPAISRPCESGSPERPTSPRVRSAGQPGPEMSFVSSERRMLHWRSWGRGRRRAVDELLRWDDRSSSELGDVGDARVRVACERGRSRSQTDVVRVRCGTACSGACQPTTLPVRMPLGLVPSRQWPTCRVVRRRLRLR